LIAATAERRETVAIDLRERIREFIADATKIRDAGEEALRHLDNGDLQGACNVISVSHYARSHVDGDYDGILKAFEAEGIEPGGG
jgi:hypothetical protein